MACGWLAVGCTGLPTFMTGEALRRIGANNVFDKKYTEWADVRDLAATSTTIDAYTQPRVFGHEK